MVSKLLNATGEYQDSRGQWFTAHDPLITKPGNATYNCCHITVPYAHTLLKAVFGANDVDVGTATTLTLGLYQADDGDAEAGTIHGSILPGVDSSGTVEITSFVPSKATTTGSRMYWLSLIGTNASDAVHRPQLSILVAPVTRSTL